MREFKIGDRVRCKVDLLDGIQKGEIRIIENIYNSETICGIKLKDNAFYHLEENFELVKENKFNVGDKVRCLIDEYKYVRKDEIVTVHRTFYDCFAIKGYTYACYLNDEFELVEEVKDNKQLQDEIDDLCTQIEMKDEELNELSERIGYLCDIIIECDDEIITYELLDEIKDREIDELEEELQISHDEYAQLYTKYQTLRNMCTQLGILIYD